MELNENAKLDASQVEDRTGRSGSGGRGGGMQIPIPTGRGGMVGLIVAVLVALVGGGLGINAATDGGGESGPTGTLAERCSVEQTLDDIKCRNLLFINSIQDYWQDALPAAFGKPYQQSTTVYFTQAVNTACGSADSGVGPFYCPADDKVYIDLAFYDVLAKQLGAPGEFAQPYVLAHEYGHHVQDLLGTEAQMRRQQERDPGNANALSVRLELQADCYAGAWANHASSTDTASGEPLFTKLTEADIQEAVKAAGAIGDDTLSGGRASEADYTHGTSDQRERWLRKGYDSGDPRQCDTFAAGSI
jgi:predicted metalloprotease